MRWKVLLLLLLCSCASQRQAKNKSDVNAPDLPVVPQQVAADTLLVEGAPTDSTTQPMLNPPAEYTPEPLQSPKPIPAKVQKRETAATRLPGPFKCPECKSIVKTKTVYRVDTVKVGVLRTALKQERKKHNVLRNKLKQTEAERDYWKEMNRKKFWALIAMAVFAVLYILFKILASRVRTN
ncbi:hypothetical protein ACSX1A_05595 [Pontibacter sp. MBLB2868]|uniref:hypothetical protein n=1 Tax=Pontibacter sp. MBLB2868 TaxID=3451555 RepID=UPI003F74AF46